MWHEGPIPPELTRYTGYLLARLGQASAARFHAALEPENLHPRLFGVMNILEARPGITQQRLAQSTAIDASSMVAVIDELEAKGLAQRRPHPEDRRARAVYPTPTAAATLKRLRKRASELQQELLSGLSAEEASTLHELLRKLANANAPPDVAPAPDAADAAQDAAAPAPPDVAPAPDAADPEQDAAAPAPPDVAPAPGAADPEQDAAAPAPPEPGGAPQGASPISTLSGDR